MSLVWPKNDVTTLSANLSLIHNCQSNLGRIRGDIDATHYCELLHKEKAESDRIRRVARTIEAKGITARRRTFKLARNHRKFVQEHLILQMQVAGISSDSSVPENKGHDEEEHSRKRERPCRHG